MLFFVLFFVRSPAYSIFKTGNSRSEGTIFRIEMAQRATDGVDINCNVEIREENQTNDIWNDVGVCIQMRAEDDTLSPTQEESASKHGNSSPYGIPDTIATHADST